MGKTCIFLEVQQELTKDSRNEATFFSKNDACMHDSSIHISAKQQSTMNSLPTALPLKITNCNFLERVARLLFLLQNQVLCYNFGPSRALPRCHSCIE